MQEYNTLNCNIESLDTFSSPGVAVEKETARHSILLLSFFILAILITLSLTVILIGKTMLSESLMAQAAEIESVPQLFAEDPYNSDQHTKPDSFSPFAAEISNYKKRERIEAETETKTTQSNHRTVKLFVPQSTKTASAPKTSTADIYNATSTDVTDILNIEKLIQSDSPVAQQTVSKPVSDIMNQQLDTLKNQKTRELVNKIAQIDIEKISPAEADQLLMVLDYINEIQKTEMPQGNPGPIAINYPDVSLLKENPAQYTLNHMTQTTQIYAGVIANLAAVEQRLLASQR
jgi:hypothetical protein